MIIRMYKKVKAILHIFAVSIIPNAPQYHKLLHTSPKKSIFTFMIFMSISIAIVTFAIYIHIIPLSVTTHIRNSFIEGLQSLPQKAQMRIEDSQLTTNFNRPIHIWNFSNKANPLYLISIDEKRTSRNYADTHALITFAKDHINLSAKDMSITRSYDGQTYLINTNSMSRFLKLVDVYAPQIHIAFYVLYFTLFPIILLGWVLAMIGVASGITYFIFHLFIKKVHFIRCIQATMHSSFIPIWVSFILFFFYPGSLSSILITPFLVGIFSLVSVFEMYFEEIPHSEPSE